jgi:hypothetical protein
VKGGRRIYFSTGELYAADSTLAATAQGSFRNALPVEKL